MKSYFQICSVILVSMTSVTLQAQTCQTAIITTAPDSRYSVNGDGTVTDKQTGLMWKQCEEGLSGSDCSTGTVQTFTWQQALQQPETVNAQGGFAGYQDWRLPNINELESLRDVSCYRPVTNTTVFPSTSISYVYWSSSPYAGSSDSAWGFSLYYGNSYYYSRDSLYYSVRLVRGGQ